jgi:hypothetical protein
MLIGYKLKQMRLNKMRGLVLVLMMFFCSVVKAQSTKHLFLPHYDEKKIHYGFHLSVNHSSFRAVHSDWFLQNDTITYLRGSGQSGFGLGFIFNFRLFEYGDFRFLPTVAFYNRSIQYGVKGQEEQVEALFQSSYVNLPLMFKYKAKRRSNARVYMVGGVNMGFQVGGKKKKKSDDQLLLKSYDISLEYGVGMDMYQEFFKFAPELRFSLGLTNLLDPTDNIYSKPMDKLTSYTVTLYLMFE